MPIAQIKSGRGHGWRLSKVGAGEHRVETLFEFGGRRDHRQAMFAM
jgi:hypothetical protein